jgi:acetolactate synthase-1/2/3 large subunit
LAVDPFPARIARGAGHAACEKIPYLAEFALDHLKNVRRMVLVGTRPPASFFAYPDLPGEMAHPDCAITLLASPADDREDALWRLADALGALATEPQRDVFSPPALPETGPNTTATVADTVAALLPDGAIVADEGITCGMEVFGRVAQARAHEWIVETGGSIGWGLPAATGAAVAAPDRKVVCLEGDGSAMYTIQALWTMAREKLDVTIGTLEERKADI